MASRYFKAFQFAKKVGPTIKGMKPTVGKAGQFVRQKIDLIKKAGKTQKKMGIDKFKELGADKTAKEILRLKVPKVRDKKADGGSISPKDIEKMKEKAKPAADRAFDILRKFKQRPATKQIKGDSGKQKEKPTGKDKPKSIREKIAPKKKMDRLKELKKELG